METNECKDPLNKGASRVDIVLLLPVFVFHTLDYCHDSARSHEKPQGTYKCFMYPKKINLGAVHSDVHSADPFFFKHTKRVTHRIHFVPNMMVGCYCATSAP